MICSPFWPNGHVLPVRLKCTFGHAKRRKQWLQRPNLDYTFANFKKKCSPGIVLCARPLEFLRERFAFCLALWQKISATGEGGCWSDSGAFAALRRLLSQKTCATEATPLV